MAKEPKLGRDPDGAWRLLSPMTAFDIWAASKGDEAIIDLHLETAGGKPWRLRLSFPPEALAQMIENLQRAKAVLDAGGRASPGPKAH